MSISNTEPLCSFVRDLSARVGEFEDESEAMKFVSERLTALVAADSWLPQACAVPGTQFYRQYLLFCDPLERFSVVSFVWGPGQETPIHNHTVWGVVGVLQGAEWSQPYVYDAKTGLVADGPPAQLTRGEIETVSPRTRDIHKVWNALPDGVSISIHVYGGNIGRIQRHVFQHDPPTVKPFVSSYSNATLPNLWAP